MKAFKHSHKQSKHIILLLLQVYWSWKVSMEKATISLCLISLLIVCSAYVEVWYSQPLYTYTINIEYLWCIYKIYCSLNFCITQLLDFFFSWLNRGKHGVWLKHKPRKHDWYNLLMMLVYILIVHRSCQEGHVMNPIMCEIMHHMLLILILESMVNVIKVLPLQLSPILVSHFYHVYLFTFGSWIYMFEHYLYWSIALLSS